MKKNYPKILIIGETFHLNSGGGITLSNLFKDWPKDRIANAADYKKSDMSEVFEDIEFYELYRDKYIFNILNYNVLGKYRRNPINSQKTIVSRDGKLKNTLKKLFFSFINKSNISHVIFRYIPSNNFIKWINDFKPDFIYSQLGSLEMILLINNIHKSTRIPIAIHIMDDWPSWKGINGFLSKWCIQKSNIEFRKILKNSSVFLSISEKMSEEYKQRYKKLFIPFHNPLDLSFWGNNNPSLEKTENTRKICILHAGRVGKGIQQSLIESASAIECLNKDGYNITLKIQSSYIEEDFVNKIKKYNCVLINPPARYQQIPEILKNADILLLCNDFDKRSIDFLRFSIPTKLSEYMISKVPILLYCSKETAVNEYASNNEIGYIVSENDSVLLKSGFKELIDNKDLSIKLANNAYNQAVKHFDSDVVREKFRFVFSNYLMNSL